MTPSSWLVPGRRGDRNVMLKVARVAEEARGSRLLAWLADSAVVAVHEVNDQAVLMDRATWQRDLTVMCQAGRDDEVTRLLCENVAALHSAAVNLLTPTDLVPLSHWFHDLIDTGASPLQTSKYGEAAAMAREVLQSASTQDAVVVHGDIHHGSVFDFGGRWLAIDPKGLFGHRAFDYANIFCNPTLELARSHYRRRLAIVSEHSGLDEDVVQSWVLSWCALSVAWTDTNDGQSWAANAILSDFA